MKWVLINKLIELIGYTRDAIYAKKKTGVWREGIHWGTASRVFLS